MADKSCPFVNVIILQIFSLYLKQKKIDPTESTDPK